MTEEAHDNSTSTVVHVIDDSMNIASVLRSHGVPVTPVYPYDTHAHQKTLADIVSGGVMGVIVDLSGPPDIAKNSNSSRSRKAESRVKPRREDVRKQASVHAYITNVMMSVLASKGFVIMMASSRIYAWDYKFVIFTIGACSLTCLLYTSPSPRD